MTRELPEMLGVLVTVTEPKSLIHSGDFKVVAPLGTRYDSTSVTTSVRPKDVHLPEWFTRSSTKIGN